MLNQNTETVNENDNYSHSILTNQSDRPDFSDSTNMGITNNVQKMINSIPEISLNDPNINIIYKIVDLWQKQIFEFQTQKRLFLESKIVKDKKVAEINPECILASESYLTDLVVQSLRYNTVDDILESAYGDGDIIWDSFLQKLKKAFRAIKLIYAQSNREEVVPNVDKKELEDYISEIQKERAYNPITEWANCITWDGSDRYPVLAELLGQDTNSNAFKFTKEWFKGSMNRFLKPGNKHDLVLVLKGKKGSGKSTFFANLAPLSKFGTAKSFKSKDDKFRMHKSALIELAELDGICRRNQVEALKAFLTNTQDQERPSYGKQTLIYPRTFTFGGTVNGSAFLNDHTGSRRFVVLEIPNDHQIDFDKVAEIRDQLWAQFKEDENLKGYIGYEEIALLEENNEDFKYLDNDLEIIRDFLDEQLVEDVREGYCTLSNGHKEPLTITFLVNFVLGDQDVNSGSWILKERPDSKLSNKVKKYLIDGLGFVYKRARVDGKINRVFLKQESEQSE